MIEVTITSIEISFPSRVIIWLDSNLDDSNEDTRNIIIKLENIVNCVKTFSDAEQCNHQEKLEQWSKQYKKLKGVFNDVEYIFDALKQDVHECKIDLASNSIDRDRLDELDPSFMYSKLLLEIISKIQYDEEGRKVFFNYCREQYPDNSLYLKSIDQFEQYYEDHSPIWWYTKETLFYSTLNFRRQIEYLHSKSQYTTKMITYRGQGLAKVDFEKLKKSIGGLLSFNNFLSTTVDREVSVMFADSVRSNPDMVGVVFQIEIDPSVVLTPYANINEINYFGDPTPEILFSTNSCFE